MVAMHHNFTATTKGTTRWRGYNWNRAVLEALIGLLETINGVFNHGPGSLPGTHENEEEVCSSREVCRIITYDQRAELFWSFLDGVMNHLDDALINRVHLGMEFKT